MNEQSTNGRDLGIRRLRLKLGLSQERFARRLNVSRWTLQRWESYELGLDPPRGRKPPGPIRLALAQIARSRHPRTENENSKRRAAYRERQLAREQGKLPYW